MEAGEDGDEVANETALDLFVRLGASWLLLKTGCEEIDKVLQGGIIKGEITELVGCTTTGKTQLCLTLVANSLLNGENEKSFIIYMDTNGSFRSSRLLQILTAKGAERATAEQMLSRVLVARVYDEHDLKAVLDAAEKRTEEIALVVVDSIGCALAETAVNYIEGGKQAQEEIIIRLREVIWSLGCAVLTTNHFVYWKSCPAPSLGQKWIQSVNTRYLTAKLPNCCYIQLIHSKRFKLSGAKAYFSINEKGIDSFTTSTMDEKQSQIANEVVSQNWNTVMQIYSQQFSDGDDQ